MQRLVVFSVVLWPLLAGMASMGPAAWGQTASPASDAVERQIDTLIRLMLSPYATRAQRDAAARDLSGLGEPAVRDLTRRLPNRLPHEQLKLLEVVGMLGPTAAPLAENLLDMARRTDHDPSVRTAALLALQKVGVSAEQLPVIQGLMRDSDEILRGNAARVSLAADPAVFERVLLEVLLAAERDPRRSAALTVRDLLCQLEERAPANSPLSDQVRQLLTWERFARPYHQRVGELALLSIFDEQ